MTYWRLHYHLIWSTFERQPLITSERERVILGVLHGKEKEFELKIHAVGMVDDHVHVLLSIPPKLAIADCVKHLKGASAHYVNRMPDSEIPLKWHEGYGVLTVDDHSFNRIQKYVLSQKMHHQERSIIDRYERLED